MPWRHALEYLNDFEEDNSKNGTDGRPRRQSAGQPVQKDDDRRTGTGGAKEGIEPGGKSPNGRRHSKNKISCRETFVVGLRQAQWTSVTGSLKEEKDHKSDCHFWKLESGSLGCEPKKKKKI